MRTLLLAPPAQSAPQLLLGCMQAQRWRQAGMQTQGRGTLQACACAHPQLGLPPLASAPPRISCPQPRPGPAAAVACSFPRPPPRLQRRAHTVMEGVHDRSAGRCWPATWPVTTVTCYYCQRHQPPCSEQRHQPPCSEQRKWMQASGASRTAGELMHPPSTGGLMHPLYAPTRHPLYISSVTLHYSCSVAHATVHVQAVVVWS